MTIYPTHTCFDDALEFLSALLKDKEISLNDSEWRLAHGLCRALDVVYSHAWVEHGDKVIFSGIIDVKEGKGRAYMTADKKEYYDHFHPFDVTTYSAMEAAIMNVTHGTYGPWEQRYKDHCGEGKIIG